jgi:hypothetical protein
MGEGEESQETGEEILEKAKQLQNKLQVETEKIYEKILEETGLSRKELDKFLDDPGNFDSETWGSMQKKKKETEEELRRLLGAKSLEEYDKSLKEKEAKKRKGKASKRSGWMPLR